MNDTGFRRGQIAALSRDFLEDGVSLSAALPVGTPLKRNPGLNSRAEDREAFEMEGKRQAEGLSISLDRHGRDLGIERVDELNIERRRDLPDIG